jgi:electron transfer flavoprotein alpha subunit
MDTSYLDWMLSQDQDTGPDAAVSEGGIWVIGEFAGSGPLAGVAARQVAAVSLEALGMARDLAGALGAYVHAVLVGCDVREYAPVLYQAGADHVWLGDHPSLAEFDTAPYMAVLAAAFDSAQPEAVVFGATGQGSALAPRLAQRTGGGLIEHVIEVELDESTRTIVATIPAFGGEYYEVVACPAVRPQFLTVEPGAFPMPYLDLHRVGEPEELEIFDLPAAVRVEGPAAGFEPRPMSLSEARVVVSAGRQAGDFQLVQELATVLGAMLGGDRGARDAGWICAEQVVDVRGVRVNPEVYVAVGVRGDTFHNAAVEGAGFVAAIHPDPEAPIFSIADLCVEAEPCDVLPRLLKALG